jgi:hypothetical protein
LNFSSLDDFPYYLLWKNRCAVCKWSY